jgi:hypothetical protein
MKFFFRTLLWAVAACAFAVGPAAALQTAPTLRHLVYNFTYGDTTDTTQHDSGIGGGPASGSTDSRAATSDKGQIAVDVIGIPADGSVVVSVSEQAIGSRSADAAHCAIWGNTNVTCEPGKKVTEEEFAVLRFLGRNFIDTSQIDANNHWKVGTVAKDLTVSNDFTVKTNVSGQLHIVESRLVKQAGAQGFTAATDGTIEYNLPMTVPSLVTEDTTTRADIGMGDYTTERTQLQVKLASDSLLPKASQ